MPATPQNLKRFSRKHGVLRPRRYFADVGDGIRTETNRFDHAILAEHPSQSLQGAGSLALKEFIAIIKQSIGLKQYKPQPLCNNLRAVAAKAYSCPH